MRIPTESKYQEATAALAAYAEFCKPYVQKNGWTVIPADVPHPVFAGAELTSDRVNAYSTTVELFELARDKPERVSAYVVCKPHEGYKVTTWTGEVIGRVIYNSSTIVRAVMDFDGRTYWARKGDMQLANFRRLTHA